MRIKYWIFNTAIKNSDKMKERSKWESVIMLIMYKNSVNKQTKQVNSTWDLWNVLNVYCMSALTYLYYKEKNA